MPIPDYQTLMRPVLEAHADGAEHERAELNGALADRVGLTDHERTETLPSGRQRRFDSRIASTIRHLVRAGLLERPRRGVTRITPRGKRILDERPHRVDKAVLKRFPEYRGLRSTAGRGGQARSGVVEGKSPDQEPPVPHQSGRERKRLRTRVSRRLHTMVPRYFPKLVARRHMREILPHARENDLEENARTTPPTDEFIDLRCIWAVEFYTPAHVSRLIAGFRDLVWDTEAFGGLPSPVQWIQRRNQRLFGGGWLNLGVIISPESAARSAHYRRAPLPAYVEYATGKIYVLDVVASVLRHGVRSRRRVCASF